MMTEQAKMLAGKLYDPSDPQLVGLRRAARLLTDRFNQTGPDEADARRWILDKLLGSVGEDVEIEPTLRVDYGTNIHLGDRVFINFDCIMLDVCAIRIGDRTKIGPRVQLLAATHPMEARARALDGEFGKPITIGQDVWLGAGVVVCPGVKIGDRSVIGAGAVVTSHIPPDSVAVGVPAKVRNRE